MRPTGIDTGRKTSGSNLVTATVTCVVSTNSWLRTFGASHYVI
jgi:hypothetical protein